MGGTDEDGILCEYVSGNSVMNLMFGLEEHTGVSGMRKCERKKAAADQNRSDHYVNKWEMVCYRLCNYLLVVCV